MTWSVPDWWSFLLLALAAFRVWRLVGEDTILDRPRKVFTDRAGDYWDTFLLCPWCAGFWISICWWVSWTVTSRWTLVVAVPFALSAVLGVVAANLDPD